MNSRNIWILGFALFLLAFLWAISDILLPFIVGLVLAYLLDPVADFLESAGCPRWLGAAILAFGAIFLAVGVFIFFAPILLQQFIDFIEQAPNYIEKLRIAVGPIITNLKESWPIFDQVSLAEKMSEAYGPHAINWVGDLTRTFWAGGLAALNFLSLVIITPIVLFYLLRDWDRLVALLIDLIPKPHSKIIKNIFSSIDQVLASFIRGQLIVCSILAFYYSGALILLGLDFALVAGIIAGLISFVPYIGMLLGLIVSLVLAFLQFGSWDPLLLVTAIFLIGQVVEGNFITPKLVGDRIGLHPVWMIFSLMVGGALLGFSGVLVAIPVAAVCGVLIRFAANGYRKST
ncbi:MAG: AI-2E family transporter [Pseudomonadota bacterium]|nr:AI-2E family transporter [Pseudomonadota bacterium]